MARKIMAVGSLYLAYEVLSTLALAAAVAYGVQLPGL
jgi:hypothetical protein